MKVLHILDHSLPYFSGYSFRSDYIIRTQQRLGLQPVVMTSPKHEKFSSDCETIGGIDFYRVHWPSISSSLKLREVPLVRQMACVAALSKEIVGLAQKLEVEIIHSHSPSLNGLAAARAAEQLKLPWLYELRYYDEDAAVDRGKIRYNSLRYKMSQKLEQSALKQATRVATISSALRRDLVKRGIEESKVFEVPNGVDTDFFQPCDPNAELIAKYGLAGHMVIGFVGSFYFFEGLEYLVDAVKLLLQKRQDVKLLLAGEGEALDRLRERIPEDLKGHFIFAGKVPHAEVRQYYSVMNVVVYPRVKSRLTELTTPLKPLEAMAMEKVVIGSRVGGIRELVKDGETGFLVEAENPEAIVECLSMLADNREKQREMGKRARAFVERDRDWHGIVKRYINVYQGMVQANGAAVSDNFHQKQMS